MEKLHLQDKPISSALLDQHMYCRDGDPELLIRTSGETRLSDFLTWQCGFTSLSILQVMWPDFSLWHLLPTMLDYQKQYPLYKQKKDAYMAKIKAMEGINEIDNNLVAQLLQEKKMQEYEAMTRGFAK